jgi:hypothetical protein
MTRFSLLIVSISFLFACNQQKPASKKSGFVKAGGFTVYYEQQGAGEPLLFLHAGLQDHAMWEMQVKRL